MASNLGAGAKVIGPIKLGAYTLNETGISKSKESPAWMFWDHGFEITWDQIYLWEVRVAIHSTKPERTSHSLFLELETTTGVYQVIQGSASQEEFYNFVHRVLHKLPDKEFRRG